jgi:hypothetical protein
MRRPKAGYALDDGGSGDPAMKEEVQDSGVDGNAVMLGSIAQVESDFNGFSRGQHGRSFPHSG